MRISELLQIERGITSIIGSGGKTTLMLRLALELKEKGTVVICTTTKIYEPTEVKTLITDSKDEVIKELQNNRVICLTSGKDTNEKLNPPNISMSELKDLADFIICEADGAKRLPLKAHSTHEPVIPDESNQVVLVVGIDGIGKPVKDVCHRYEIYKELSGINEDSLVTPEIAMSVINKEKLGTKIFINKVETEEQMSFSKEMSNLTDIPVIAGSLRNGEYVCLY